MLSFHCVNVSHGVSTHFFTSNFLLRLGFKNISPASSFTPDSGRISESVSRVTLRLAVYRPSLRLGDKPFETDEQ
jgi:hypothetical protein